jgi:hypothetical protein
MCGISPAGSKTTRGAAQRTQARTASFRPYCSQGAVTRQELQMTRPSPRQWCLRLSSENSDAQLRGESVGRGREGGGGGGGGGVDTASDELDERQHLLPDMR